MQELPKLPDGWHWEAYNASNLTPTARNDEFEIEVFASSQTILISGYLSHGFSAPNEVVLAVLMLAAKLT